MKLKSLIVFWSTLGWGNVSSFFSSEIEQCDSASCTNTGNRSSCVNLARGEYVCACNLHTKACPIDTSTCYPNPCGHHGTCMVDEYDRFTCKCQPGWSGPICAESKTYLAFLSYVKDKFNKYQRIADADYWPIAASVWTYKCIALKKLKLLATRQSTHSIRIHFIWF